MLDGAGFCERGRCAPRGAAPDGAGPGGGGGGDGCGAQGGGIPDVDGGVELVGYGVVLMYDVVEIVDGEAAVGALVADDGIVIIVGFESPRFVAAPPGA